MPNQGMPVQPQEEAMDQHPAEKRASAGTSFLLMLAPATTILAVAFWFIWLSTVAK